MECFRGGTEGTQFYFTFAVLRTLLSCSKMCLLNFYPKTCTPVKGTPWSTAWSPFPEDFVEGTKPLGHVNRVFQTFFFFCNLASGGGGGGWKGELERGWGWVGEGLPRGLERGWGRVGEGLAFYSSKTPLTFVRSKAQICFKIPCVS